MHHNGSRFVQVRRGFEEKKNGSFPSIVKCGPVIYCKAKDYKNALAIAWEIGTYGDTLSA